MARLIEALDNYYPVLHQILGDEDFEALGSAFVRAHPVGASLDPLVWPRDRWPFLRAEPPFAEQPILAEIARFEWTLAESFDAADAAVARPRRSCERRARRVGRC